MTWESFGQDSYIEPPTVGSTSQYVYQYGIFQQLFDPDGNAIGGEEQVNTSAEGQQKDARVHVLSDGGYITAWYHANSITDDNPGINLFYQRFDENGETVGEQTLLPATIEDPYFPGQTVSFEVKFAALPNGYVAAAWSATGVSGFFVTGFDPNGTQVSQFGIDVLSFPYGQGYLELVALPDGNLFVVHNTRNGQLNFAYEHTGTVYSPTGEIVVPTFPISEEDGVSHFALQVLLLPDGNLLVTSSDRNYGDLFAQVVSPEGTVLTDPIQLNLLDTSATDGRVTILADGRISVVYTADYGSGGTIVTRIVSIDLDPISTTLSDMADTFVLTGQANELVVAGDGDDHVIGAAGDDRIFGEDGNDIIRGGLGDDALFGGAGSDVLNGDDGNDTIEGNDGDDEIMGDDGDDHLDGGAGNDVVYGGDGNDLLTAYSGQDVLWGGLGNDIIAVGHQYKENAGPNHEIHGGDGNDTIRTFGSDHTAFGDAGDDFFEINSTGDFYGGEGDDYFWASAGNIYGGDGIDTFVVEGFATVNTDTHVWISGLPSTDSEYSIENVEIIRFRGGVSGDLYAGNWVFVGGGGNDTVTYTWGVFDGIGGGGDDVFLAENTEYVSPDEIIPSTAHIDGGDGNDTIIGGTSFDIFSGGDGGDILFGNAYDDVLHGNAGNDTIDGGEGNDLLSGGQGDDEIFGGIGDDTLQLSGTVRDYLVEAHDQGVLISGPDGTDYVVGVEFVSFDDGSFATLDTNGFTVLNSPPIVTVPLVDQISAEDEVVNFTIPLDTFADEDSALAYSATLVGGDDLPHWLLFDATTLSFNGAPPQDFNGSLHIAITASDGSLSVTDDFELVITPVDDPLILSTTRDGGTLSGAEAGDVLTGSFGADIIHGHGGADVILDVGGDNIVSGGDGDDRIRLVSGTNTASGGTGDDLIIGGYDNDSLSGGDGDDIIRGDVSNNVGAADSITGGFGDDLLEGGGGTDTFVFTTNDGNDTIGTLDIDFSGVGSASANVVGADFFSGVDVIALSGFGFSDGAGALSHVTDVNGVAVFSDQGTTITFVGLTSSDLSSDDFNIL